jgi:hypothetical protein
MPRLVPVGVQNLLHGRQPGMRKRQAQVRPRGDAQIQVQRHQHRSR